MELVDFKVVEKGDFLKKEDLFTAAFIFSSSINILYAVASFILHTSTKGFLLGRL